MEARALVGIKHQEDSQKLRLNTNIWYAFILAPLMQVVRFLFVLIWGRTILPIGINSPPPDGYRDGGS